MSIVKTVNFSDGEALTHGDLNNAQRYAQAFINDILLRERMRMREGHGPSPGTGSTSAVFGFGGGAGVNETATALRSTNREGVIATCATSAAIDGNDPKVLVYYLAADELLTNHDAAHATLDRWDIICIKLDQVVDGAQSRDFEDAVTRAPSSQTENKTRSVVLTKQVVKGTNAAAGTAVEPAVPAGFQKWAALKIPAAFASPFDVEAHVRDWRVPMGGVVSGMVHAGQFYNESYGTLGTAGFVYLATGSGQ